MSWLVVVIIVVVVVVVVVTVGFIASVVAVVAVILRKRDYPKQLHQQTSGPREYFPWFALLPSLLLRGVVWVAACEGASHGAGYEETNSRINSKDETPHHIKESSCCKKGCEEVSGRTSSCSEYQDTESCINGDGEKVIYI